MKKGTRRLQKLKEQIEEENIDNIRKEKKECFSESMLGDLSGGVGPEDGRGGWACLIDGCFVGGLCMIMKSVVRKRHVEAFFKEGVLTEKLKKVFGCQIKYLDVKIVGLFEMMFCLIVSLDVFKACEVCMGHYKVWSAACCVFYMMSLV